ncbi:MAG: AAA family ATPase [Xanthomonadales bacterium]|nr:AAA family ATPase [Xanthomonadales bacterium]
MLTELHVRDFAIVGEAAIRFGPGLTVISGETGAGKSLLVDALALACGARGDPGWVRQGAERAEVAASFEVPADHPAQAVARRAWPRPGRAADPPAADPAHRGRGAGLHQRPAGDRGPAARARRAADRDPRPAPAAAASRAGLPARAARPARGPLRAARGARRPRPALSRGRCRARGAPRCGRRSAGGADRGARGPRLPSSSARPRLPRGSPSSRRSSAVWPTPRP